MMREGTVVTFYSYKGGVGRTLALANIGALLCRWGYKVLCVDWDLEAPGLHLYYKRWMQQEKPGLVDLLHAFVEQQQPAWQDYITEVAFPGFRQSLSLLQAGKQDPDYVGLLQTLDWKTLYEEQGLGQFLEDLRDQWKAQFDFILIDSRTGISDAGGICTVQMPDLLVLLFTANEQSLDGAINVLARAQQARDRLPFDRGKLLALPVAARFEGRIEYELAQQWLGKFAERLAPVYADWTHKDATPAELLNHTRIPYIPYWSFGEKLPVIDKGTDDQEDIGYPLETLAALIAQQLSNSYLLLNNRDAYVRSAVADADAEANLTQATGSASGTSIASGSCTGNNLMLVYSEEDEPTFKRLLLHLKPFIKDDRISIWNDMSPYKWRPPLPTEQYREAIIKAWNGGDKDTYHYLLLQDMQPILDRAKVTVLLVSPYFLASDKIMTEQMPLLLAAARSGTLRLFWVPAGYCAWEETPVSQFRALLSPDMPLDSMSTSSKDQALLSVCRKIKEALGANG